MRPQLFKGCLWEKGVLQLSFFQISFQSWPFYSLLIICSPIWSIWSFNCCIFQGTYCTNISPPEILCRSAGEFQAAGMPCNISKLSRLVAAIVRVKPKKQRAVLVDFYPSFSYLTNDPGYMRQISSCDLCEVGCDMNTTVCKICNQLFITT